MSAINDLIAQIADEGLRQRIDAEVKRLLKQKKFGLVFEEHQPEGLTEGPVYPYLQVLDQVQRAPGDKLWHALIESDNYYALQLLAYLYAGQVDCIYIDPPYNTGARDWKYNNDYVDSSDQYRHSKWLSMMKRRLKLAKKLLNPKDSVLIVTIDEKEYLHLGCLLEEMFPEARMQMVSTVIKTGGSKRYGGFTRSGEYIYFLMFGGSVPRDVSFDMSKGIIEAKGKKQENPVSWQGLRRRGGDNWARRYRPNLFYPVFINKDTHEFVGVGDSPALEENRRNVSIPEGTFAVWPLAPDGQEGRWQISQERFLQQYKAGTLIINSVDENTGFASILYLKSGDLSRIESGILRVVGKNEKGQTVFETTEKSLETIKPCTIWNMPYHDASTYGSLLLRKILPSSPFSYPKSLYAVHDCIDLFVRNKPNALILDFFAGSGTTLHAVNLLNAEDGGHRRCIMVTNNEVSDQEAKTLTKQGFKPGDDEWERLGIARYVNWPRTVCSIEGHDVNGLPLKGEYLGTDHRQMKDGFEANCIFFKLGFLDKTQVALGRQFRELLPLLWMKAGGVGPCPQLSNDTVPQMLVLPENKFAVLTDERAFSEFLESVNEHDDIRMVYLVTDSDSMYCEMSRSFPKRQTCQLYRDYLDNFRINHTR